MRRNEKAGPSSRAAIIGESEDDAIELMLSAPKARTVYVAGSFNGWDPQRTALRKDSRGVWHVTLPLSGGRYEYRLVVDGQWQEDPSAKESVPNPHGGRNSVLVVPGATRPPRSAVKEW